MTEIRDKWREVWVFLKTNLEGLIISMELMVVWVARKEGGVEGQIERDVGIPGDNPDHQQGVLSVELDKRENAEMKEGKKVEEGVGVTGDSREEPGQGAVGGGFLVEKCT